MFKTIQGGGRKAAAAVSAFVGMCVLSVAGAASAFATTTDPTGGATTTTLTNLQSWVQTYGAPLLAGLLVLGAIFVVLIKFVKKGARAV